MNIIDIYNGWKNMINFNSLSPDKKAMTEKRMSICAICPYLKHQTSVVGKVISTIESMTKPTIEQQKTVNSVCTKLGCGCQMNALLTLDTSKCPDKPPRW